jgi:hypothetical protein
VFIRYFARTDESELGRAAVSYCDHLVATGLPVRLVSTKVAELQLDSRGRGGGIWGRYRDLLITPMEGGYINAVCGEPGDWGKLHTPGAHRNVLLLADPNLMASVPQSVLMAAVDQYDAVYALTRRLADVIVRVTGKEPHVAPAGMTWVS